MTLIEAESLIGRANACEPFLSNMIKALDSPMAHRLLNSPDDERRLVAAKIVRPARRKGRRA